MFGAVVVVAVAEFALDTVPISYTIEEYSRIECNTDFPPLLRLQGTRTSDVTVFERQLL